MTYPCPGRLAVLAGLALGDCHSRFDIRRDVPGVALMAVVVTGAHNRGGQDGHDRGNIARGDDDNDDKGPGW